MEGPILTMEDLLGLREGNVLVFDFPVSRAIELSVNGSHKFTAQVVSTGRKRACLVEMVRPPGQGSTSELPAPGEGGAASA